MDGQRWKVDGERWTEGGARLVKITKSVDVDTSVITSSTATWSNISRAKFPRRHASASSPFPCPSFSTGFRIATIKLLRLRFTGIFKRTSAPPTRRLHLRAGAQNPLQPLELGRKRQDANTVETGAAIHSTRGQHWSAGAASGGEDVNLLGDARWVRPVRTGWE